MITTPEIQLEGDPPKVRASIHWRGCIIRTPHTYTNRTDALRGAVRALRRIGYRGAWQKTISPFH
jgi:hypothetical protein